jgi:hypothetical protein
MHKIPCTNPQNGVLERSSYIFLMTVDQVAQALYSNHHTLSFQLPLKRQNPCLR